MDVVVPKLYKLTTFNILRYRKCKTNSFDEKDTVVVVTIQM